MVDDVSVFRLYLLRAMYALIALGLASVIWPSILFPSTSTADESSVIRALLGALAVLAVLGIRYPLRMLPLLLFELAWKIIWVVASAIPMWRGPGLDAYASETLFACLMGVVLVPLVLPWRHVYRHYVAAPGERWRARPGAPAAKVSAGG